MNQSPELNELFTALAKAQQEMDAASLDSNNPFFKSKYASFTELVRVSRPSLTKHGLSVLQQIIVDVDTGHLLLTKLCHSSGQWVQSAMKINPTKQDVQAIGSYITYLKRYSYAALVGVVIDEESIDDDGNTAMPSYKSPEKITSTPTTFISIDQLDELTYELNEYPDIKKLVLDALKISSLDKMPKTMFLTALNRIRDIKKARESIK